MSGRRGLSGPLGALPALSPSARRALVLGGLLSVGHAAALVAQAWGLATALARVVGSGVDAAAVRGPLLVLAGAIVARAVFGWATEAVSARAAAGAKEELRTALLDASLRRGPEWIASRGAGPLATLATRGLDGLDAYFTRYLPALITAVVVPLLIGVWILWSDPTSAVLILLTVPLIPLFAWLVGRYTESRTARAADATARLSGHLLELVRALPVLAAFGRARAQVDAVRRVSEQHRRATTSTLRVAFLSALVLELFSSLSVALVAVGIGLRLVGGELDLATGLLVLVLAPECYLPLRNAGAAHHASEDGLEAVRRVWNVVAEAPEEKVGRTAPPQGALTVRELRVQRRDGYAPDGVSFTVRPGEVVPLDEHGIGPSGSGKSTLFAVLLRFVAPDHGAVFLDDTDMSTVGTSEWRRQIAWVPQRPVFTGGTVRDELHVAVADVAEQPAVIDEEQLHTALSHTAAAHLLDRRIDELSTGERQRVAVARALLRTRHGATILLLDEPTAHLDAATAATVRSTIRATAADGAAVLLADHRGAENGVPESAESPVEESAATSSTSGRPAPARTLLNRHILSGALAGALSLLAGLGLTAASAWLIARASQQPPVLALSVATVGVRTFALSKAALRYVERLLTHDGAFRTATDLRTRLWSALVRQGPVATAPLRRGDGAARLVDDVDTVRDLVPRVLAPPLVAVVVAAGAVTLETWVLPPAGALFAVCLLVAGVAAPLVAVAVQRRAGRELDDGRRDIAARVLGLLDAAAELLAFGAARRRRAELATADSALSARERRIATAAGAATAVLTAVLGVATFGGAWLAANAVAAGTLAPVLAPLLALVPLTATEVVATLPPAAQQWTQLRRAQARVAAVADAPTTQQANAGSTTSGATLSDVDLVWPGADQPALRGLDVHLSPGSWVAVTGPSGAGKSTLLAALLGFLPAARGRIALPPSLSWCPQEPQLVSTTIRENLRVADPHATDARLADVLERAGLAEYTDRLDTLVASGGTALSGGQAQRLALARALLGASPGGLLLLDEPTAHLDTPTADAVLAGLRRALDDGELAGCTVVHVTHRSCETDLADTVLHVSDATVQQARRTGDARQGAPLSG